MKGSGQIRMVKMGECLLIVVVMLVASPALAEDDNRCFLTGGGSTEIFFVPEDLEVGSDLGRLRISGNP